MKISILQLFILILLISGCKTHQVFLDAVWENPDYESADFDKIAVFAIVDSEKNKKDFEKDAVKYFKSKGIIAVPGFEIYESKDMIIDLGNDQIKKDLFEQGFDGVLATKVLGLVEKEADADTVNRPSRHANQLYRYGQYYTPRYEHLQNSIDKNYAVIESNFYLLQDNSNFEGRGLIWISHYKMENEDLSHIDIEIDNYAHTIVQSLFDDQVITPSN